MEIKDFVELKEKIDKAKTQRARAEGSIEEAMNRLKAEFNCESIEDAKKLLNIFEKEIAEGEDKITKILEEIETVTDWDKL